MPAPQAPATPQPSDPAAAWTPADLSADVHRDVAKPDKVRRMFAAIAGSYDLNNRVHSFGRDQAWRRAAVRLAAVGPRDHVLDCACGTGDLTRLFAAAGAARVVGLDFTQEMLDIACRKREEVRAAQPKAPPSPLATIEYRLGDAMALPFDDASFDIVSIAFGLRNVADPAAAVGEFRRVLRPGGRLVVLEFDRPRNPVVRWVSDFYTKVVMPRTATLLSRDRSGAYRYLPKSVETFLDRDQVASLLTARGFAHIRQSVLSLGVCVATVGVRAG